jgi:hypothetical protein
VSRRTAEGQLGRHAIFKRDPVKLLKPVRLNLDERLVGHIGQR